MPTDDETLKRPLPTDGPTSIWLHSLRALAAIVPNDDASVTVMHSFVLVVANVHDALNDSSSLLPTTVRVCHPLDSLKMPRMPTVIVD